MDVSDPDDVQRLYLLLEPHTPPGGKCRLIVLPKKKLPDTQRHERFFAFVGERLTRAGAAASLLGFTACRLHACAATSQSPP